MPLEAWYMDDDTETDQREPHRKVPNEPCSFETLDSLGVLHWHLDADNHETDPALAAIRAERGYTYSDIITVSADTLPNYEAKIRSFYEEHMHTDEEIRYLLDGTGYFDVRDARDRWIRVAMGKGDMIVLPAGIYHRFTLDANNYTKAMRLFVGAPVWTPHNRPQDAHPVRRQYVEAFVAPPAAAAAAEVH